MSQPVVQAPLAVRRFKLSELPVVCKGNIIPVNAGITGFRLPGRGKPLNLICPLLRKLQHNQQGIAMIDVNIEQARYNMIEQQIRPWDVLDYRVLDVLKNTPRERFVPKEYANLAFTDTEIPLGHGRVTLEPKMEGRILQELAIKPTDSILEIGTGSGYLTACLAKLGSDVVTVELHPDLSQHAQQQVAGQGLENVQFRIADAAEGWSGDGNFDVIVITGSLPVMQESFKKQLNIGGRMFVVVGEAPIMEALLITRTGDNDWEIRSLFETSIPALENAVRPQKFTF
jgi:protein-L-isoaspartate(D-aspartate) O-methyltransferase